MSDPSLSRLQRVVIICAVLSAAIALPAAAQLEAKMLRIGAATPPPSSATYAVSVGSILDRLAELGYSAGRNFVFEAVPFTGRGQASYDRAFREVASRQIDIFLSAGTEPMLKAARAVAGSTPIVMVAVNIDPLDGGYVASLPRPGGNITGVVFREVELTAKRLQLLKDILPGLKAATVFWDRLSADQWRVAKAAAAKLGLQLHGVEFGAPPFDFERAFRDVPTAIRGAVVPMGSPRFALPKRKSLPEFALRHRVPTMFFMRAYVDHGGLASYGPSYPEMFAKAADYIDRIAKGAAPADLPVEQPTKFDLVVNLKTAKALGITIPLSILLRATEVIE